jgi:hypothetical protein
MLDKFGEEQFPMGNQCRQRLSVEGTSATKASGQDPWEDY